jgi:catechol 2,3-dioxygenase-like lactoylglutathione lyase family enzyme
MFDHVSIGVSDLKRAKRFYDSTLNPLGYQCLSEGDGHLGYGRDSIGLWITPTAQPVVDDKKSGLHFCFAAPDTGSVDAFHAGALAAGGSDNGKPGVRKDYSPGYYAAFAVDPDGYRLEAYFKQA